MGFEIDITHQLGTIPLRARIAGTGGVTALFGPSGAGKTSIVKAMAGLIRPDQGHIRLGDRVLFDSAKGIFLPPRKRRLGYVFQDGRLFPHMSVLQNLRFSAPYRGGAQVLPEDRLVDLLGLRPLLDRRPATLSGGETQRVAVARALLSAPDMLLMDEPLAALDDPRKDEILPYLDRLKAETGMPILYVTHAVGEIARLADHVVLLQAGQVVQQGPVFDMLSDPAAMPFLGVREAGAVIEAEVTGHDSDGLTRLRLGTATLELPGVEAAPGETLRLRILARDVLLATHRPTGLSARNILPARIVGLQTGRGPGTAVVLDVGGQRLLARLTDRSVADLGLKIGEEVYAIVKSTSVGRRAITT